MDRGDHKLYHVHGLDSRSHLDTYMSGKDMTFADDAFTFPMKKLHSTFKNLGSAQERYKKAADKFSKPAPAFKVGDLVWLSTRNLKLRIPSSKLGQKYVGPYKITKIAAVPNTFPGRSASPPDPVLTDGQEQFVVEKILDSSASESCCSLPLAWSPEVCGGTTFLPSSVLDPWNSCPHRNPSALPWTLTSTASISPLPRRSVSSQTRVECIAPLFQTVQETPQPVSTKVSGTIPAWIRGRLLRNGPGRFEFGNDKYNHWFDGIALMHSFKIENGSVTYMSKFLQSDSYTRNKSANRIVMSEFGTLAAPDPCKSLYNRFMSRFKLGMSENYVVFVEQPLRLNIMKMLMGQIRGKAVSESITWEPQLNTVFHVISKRSGEKHSATFHTKAFSTFHQINAYEDQGCIVLDLCCQDDGGVMATFQLENLRQSGKDLEKLLRQMSKPYPRRFVLPLDDHVKDDLAIKPLNYSSATAAKKSDGKIWCTHENLHDHTLDSCGMEFPHINYAKYNTKKYRYVYGCGFQHLVGDSLIKVDVETKKAKVWKEDGYYPSEPVFVPSPDSVEEDDGVLLSAVVTPHQDRNIFLLILDAKNFTEMARAEAPVQSPYGFHGVFVPHRA
ncbi:LOW QUALITY PROTEIN: carotenoid-cleaving dioxygenase, mitochondrial-like [Anomaloglossus baeobatrachus]|uniref:LOW QUALITY PROTEIN: carotenoid-cleaving dioxygenase, mitochondrial-like n=1 Tax=Anomaloglossus baeobatrachus TaxID=238106 RepID=UPI003F50B44F